MPIRSRYLPFALALSLAVIFSANLGSTQAALEAQCPGAPPVRLAVGSRGHLSPTDPGQATIPVRMHETPGKTSKSVGQLLSSATFQVVSGPTCKEGYAWFQVVSQGALGWIAEGDSNGYFVDPISGPAPTQVPLTDSGTSGSNQSTPTLPPIVVAPRTEAGFATFSPGSVESQGKIAPYQVASDFGNVVLSAILTPQQLDYLQRNGFVVSPGDAPEFYAAYQAAANANQPQLITTDSLLHSFHIAFDKVVRDTETQYLMPLLRHLNKSLLVEADKNYQALRGTAWEDGALRTVAYIAVVSKLADPSVNVPSYASALASTEIANVSNASGVAPSAVFPGLVSGEDWSQYVPRGHYANSSDLKAYFQAMTYYGRMVFHLNNGEETQSALLLAAAIRSAKVDGGTGADAWGDLYDCATFFMGQSDTLTVRQYLQLIDQVYGPGADVVTMQKHGLDPFLAAAQAVPIPKLLNTASSEGQNNALQDRGLRLMGEPFSWDEYAFQQLVYPNVGTLKQPRGLPMGLDLFATLGSDRALQILDKEGATASNNYTTQINTLRAEIGSPDESEMTGSLYGSWLYTEDTLNDQIATGSPAFMLNQPYADRNLFATLGGFAERRQDSLLHVETGALPTAPSVPVTAPNKSAPPQALRPPNYVEPVPVFWARLAALAEMTSSGLGSRNLLAPADAALLKQLGDLARRLQDFSTKELNNIPLTADEQVALNHYGDDLENILKASSDSTSSIGTGSGSRFTDPPTVALIEDIATDGSSGKSQALEVGLGRVFDIYAIVPIGTKLYLTRGAVYSYYEFPQPTNARLTGDSWQQLLDAPKAPTLPDWTFSFVAAETADPALWDTLRNFQTALVNALWYDPAATYAQLHQSTAGSDKFVTAQIDPLARARQYEGRQLLGISFRSIQSPDDKTSIVVLRETWRGELHNSATDQTANGPIIGERGPYSLEVAYTLTKDASGAWTVSTVSVNGTPPNWANVSQ